VADYSYFKEQEALNVGDTERLFTSPNIQKKVAGSTRLQTHHGQECRSNPQETGIEESYAELSRTHSLQQKRTR